MSRIGKQTINFDKSIKVSQQEGGVYGGLAVTVEGPKGILTLDVRPGINIDINSESGEVSLTINSSSQQMRAYYGLYRSLINNMVIGVKDGYEKKLEIQGTGYRAKPVGNDIEFSLGFTHPILFKAPEGITFEIEKEVNVTISGIDKQLVGETAARIRELRKPEPYKGKGVRYQGEFVRRKVGKAMSK
jgi:large subunit ribosomal protein L6